MKRFQSLFKVLFKLNLRKFYQILFFILDRDIIGLAETGSGKTGAFAIPILDALLIKPQRLFALILTPTRELAYQINEQFQALGTSFGVKCGTFNEVILFNHPNLTKFITSCDCRWNGHDDSSFNFS